MGRSEPEAEDIALKIIPPKTKSITQVTTQQKLIVSQKIRDRDTQGLVICEAKTEQQRARSSPCRRHRLNYIHNYNLRHRLTT